MICASARAEEMNPPAQTARSGRIGCYAQASDTPGAIGAGRRREASFDLGADRARVGSGGSIAGRNATLGGDGAGVGEVCLRGFDLSAELEEGNLSPLHLGFAP